MSNHGKDKIPEEIVELKKLLERNALSSIDEKKIFHPEEGLVKKVMSKVNVTSVQLRKIFQEFRAVIGKGEPNMARLYKMYALLEYQWKRGVLDENFKDLIFELLKNLERNSSKEDFEKAYDILMAMVAYSKKS